MQGSTPDGVNPVLAAQMVNMACMISADPGGLFTVVMSKRGGGFSSACARQSLANFSRVRISCGRSHIRYRTRRPFSPVVNRPGGNFRLRGIKHRTEMAANDMEETISSSV